MVENTDIGTFLTEFKPSTTRNVVTKRQSQSIPQKITDKNIVNSSGQSPKVNFMSQTARHSTSPDHTMMMSFNFMTQLPIEDFISREQFKASKITERHKSRASLKVEMELQRKIRDKELTVRLHKAYSKKDSYVHEDYQKYREKEREKLERVQETLKKIRKEHRAKQLKSEQKYKEEEVLRKQKLDEIKMARITEIQRNMDRIAAKTLNA